MKNLVHLRRHPPRYPTADAKIEASGQQFDAMVAIGGGGFIPARILRSFLNIPIYTVTLAYYDANDKPTDSPQKSSGLKALPPSARQKHLGGG